MSADIVSIIVTTVIILGYGGRHLGLIGASNVRIIVAI